MKRKIIMMMLSVAVGLALIAGATWAWFTAEDDAGDAVFTAGTVKISAGDALILGKTAFDNVNPGDCFIVSWEFENEGSKAIELRTSSFAYWNGVDPELYAEERKGAIDWNDYWGMENVFVIPHKDSSAWKLYQDAPGEPMWAYYTGGPIAPGEKVTLRLVVYFDGELTGNAYQGATFTLEGTAEAVQASNGAPIEVWGMSSQSGELIWETVTDPGYYFDYLWWYEKWQEFDIESLPCYNADITVLEFNDIEVGDEEADGVWYPDRQKPHAFKVVEFDGDYRLMHSINAANVPIHDFYQYQGMKYNTAGAKGFSIDLYIPSDWQNGSDVRAGIWAVAGNSELTYPIVEFTNNDSNPRFRIWQSHIGWVDIGLPSGFEYDKWYSLNITLNTDLGNVTYTVGDLVGILDSFDADNFINVILQGHNPRPNGATYDIYWDNLRIVK